MIIFGEHPSALQLVGVVAILGGLVVTARSPGALEHAPEGLPSSG
jgi:drug/metabolite transporter (DMT)-like permease